MASHGLLEERDGDRFATFHVGRRYMSTDERGTRAHSAVTAQGLVRSALSVGGGFVLDQKILAIQGRSGHGLSWAAQELLEAAGREDPPWKTVVVLDERRGLAEALATAGWKPVHRALRSGGAAVGGAFLGRALALLLFLASLAAASGAVGIAVGSGGSAGPDVPLLLGTGSCALAGAWWLTRRHVAAGMCNRLASCLADPALDEKAALAAGQALGQRLAGLQMFLVAVVDCYSQRPLAVRTAIIEAMRLGRRECAVIWLVFDADEPGLFRKNLVGLRECGPGGLSVVTCEMLSLTADERAGISGANGLSPADAKDDDALFDALRRRARTV